LKNIKQGGPYEILPVKQFIYNQFFFSILCIKCFLNLTLNVTAKNKYILESSASSKNDSDVVVGSPKDQAKSYREYR